MCVCVCVWRLLFLRPENATVDLSADAPVCPLRPRRCIHSPGAVVGEVSDTSAAASASSSVSSTLSPSGGKTAMASSGSSGDVETGDGAEDSSETSGLLGATPFKLGIAGVVSTKLALSGSCASDRGDASYAHATVRVVLLSRHAASRGVCVVAVGCGQAF
jgi:hypothetical protein